MGALPPSRESLLAELLEALGGAARIASVRSYARHALLRLAGPPREGAEGARGARRTDPGTSFSRARFLPPTGACHELLYRAAPGRARLELGTADGADPDRAVIALAGPDAPHDGRPGAHGPDGPADCPACAGAAVLREAAREPRNVLAHADERGAHVSRAAGGEIELALAEEGLLYRFDRDTRLCARRIDGDGRSTAYHLWQRVDGVSTPFLEIEEGPAALLERRVLGVAYDLLWPDRLYQVPTPRP